jgi:alpha-D-ribose 1-methylphosphonate 5-triphosphate synthase subunit PhnH
VSNEVPSAPPLVYEGLDPAMEPKSSTAEVSDAVKEAIRTIKNAMEAARKPGMPLSILSNVAREAPLGSLLIAFLLGIAVARRARR